MVRWLVIAAVATSCYRAPQPACGFVCGDNGACPNNYSCAADNRCHLDGVGSLCESAVDAGMDGGPDAPFDAPELPLVDLSITNPLDGETGVSVATEITLFLSMQLFGELDNSAVNVSSTAGTVDVMPVTAVGSMAVIQPTFQLLGNVTYTIEIGPTFTNPVGYMNSAYQWQFTTGPDTAAPELSFEMPADMDTNVPDTAPIIVYFDEPVANVDSTSFTVSSGGTPIPGTITAITTYAYQFNPTAPYPSGSVIDYALSSAITDLFANAFVPVDITFTTQ